MLAGVNHGIALTSAVDRDICHVFQAITRTMVEAVGSTGGSHIARLAAAIKCLLSCPSGRCAPDVAPKNVRLI